MREEVTLKEIVEAVRKASIWLKENPENRVVGVLATNQLGHSVHTNSRSASRFCAVGRIIRELGEIKGRHILAQELSKNILLQHGFNLGSLAKENDCPTASKYKVIEMMDSFVSKMDEMS